MHLLGAPEAQNGPGHEVVVHCEPDPEAWSELGCVECEEPVCKEKSFRVAPEVRVAEEAGLEQDTHPCGRVRVGDAVDVHLGEVDLRA